MHVYTIKMLLNVIKKYAQLLHSTFILLVSLLFGGGGLGVGFGEGGQSSYDNGNANDYFLKNFS